MKNAVVVCGIIALLGCTQRDEPRGVATANADTVRTIVDSIFPVEEEIRRFKAARPGNEVTQLGQAASSRDQLVSEMISAIENKDSTQLRARLIDDREFIDLYYPTSFYARQPYKQSPELLWFLMQQNSTKGMRRALERFGGKPLHYSGYECTDSVVVEGENRIWQECRVRWAPAPGVQSPYRLFGSIIERAGRFKFVSYANDL